MDGPALRSFRENKGATSRTVGKKRNSTFWIFFFQRNLRYHVQGSPIAFHATLRPIVIVVALFTLCRKQQDVTTRFSSVVYPPTGLNDGLRRFGGCVYEAGALKNRDVRISIRHSSSRRVFVIRDAALRSNFTPSSRNGAGSGRKSGNPLVPPVSTLLSRCASRPFRHPRRELQAVLSTINGQTIA